MDELIIKYIELSKTIKDLEAQKKELGSQILAEMREKGVQKHYLEGIGTASITSKSVSKVNNESLKLGLASRGVHYETINEAFIEATSVTPQEFVTVKAAKE